MHIDSALCTCVMLEDDQQTFVKYDCTVGSYITRVLSEKKRIELLSGADILVFSVTENETVPERGLRKRARVSSQTVSCSGEDEPESVKHNENLLAEKSPKLEKR